jgi:RNA polymerase sigma-70 factor (ECF subfamily)
MNYQVGQLEVLYRVHGPALSTYLRRLIGRADLAEDLFQETFVQALRSVHRVTEAASPRAWLFRIAHNVAVSHLRGRRITFGLPETLPATTGNAEHPGLEQMRLAICKLPEKLRETLELRLQGELAYDEIAEVLGIPVGTVRSRLHHAVQQLREALTDEAAPHRRPSATMYAEAGDTSTRVSDRQETDPTRED